jgi:uncharacterized phage protein (TIGR02218 family)
MKTASAALIELLNTSEMFYPADLYTFTLVSGTVVRYTSHDVNIWIGTSTPVLYTPMTLQRDRIKLETGLTIDDLKIEIYANSDDTIGGSQILSLIRGGSFDGAILSLDRVFNPTFWQYNTPPISTDYTVNLFLGRADAPNITRQIATLEVKSLTELLNIKMPRNLAMPSCVNTLYDYTCALNRADFEVNGTVTSGSTTTVINNDLATSATYYDLGVLLFTSGNNNGNRRFIKKYAPGTIQITPPLPYAPEAGDTFQIVPGCDKTQETCLNKFNNLVNFKGMPYVPTTESIL